MNLKTWEATINQIVDVVGHEMKERARQNILLAWRAKLEKEPTSLQPFQFDQIVREVRKRLTAASR